MTQTLAARYGASPHRNAGAGIRRAFHTRRSAAIEPCNERVKAIFSGHTQVPTRGRHRTRRFVLGAVLVSQLALRHRFGHGQHLRIGRKACLLAA
jgi:hypothetical protein